MGSEPFVVVYEEPDGRFTWSSYDNRKQFEDIGPRAKVVRVNTRWDEAKRICDEHNKTLCSKL